MLDLHFNKNGKKKKIYIYIYKKKINMRFQDSNPGSMGSKFTELSTTQWRPMELTDKNN